MTLIDIVEKYGGIEDRTIRKEKLHWSQQINGEDDKYMDNEEDVAFNQANALNRELLGSIEVDKEEVRKIVRRFEGYMPDYIESDLVKELTQSIEIYRRK